jgi:hypothetical protein
MRDAMEKEIQKKTSEIRWAVRQLLIRAAYFRNGDLLTAIEENINNPQQLMVIFQEHTKVFEGEDTDKSIWNQHLNINGRYVDFSSLLDELSDLLAHEEERKVQA